MKDKLLRCIKQKKTDYVPIWFMRQAGRYLPEFREIRSKNQDFLKLCFNPELSKEISLQPLKRFDLDAAIIFSDILTVPHALKQNVNFVKNEGPILDNLNLKETLNITASNFSKTLKPNYDAIKLLKKNLPENKSLIGFIGAPWTLLVYMLHKKSPKKEMDLEGAIIPMVTLNKIIGSIPVLGKILQSYITLNVF